MKSITKTDVPAEVTLSELKEMSKDIEIHVDKRISTVGFTDGIQIVKDTELGIYKSISFYIEEERFGEKKEVYCAFSQKAIEKFDGRIGESNLLYETAQIKVTGSINQQSRPLLVIIDVDDYVL